MRKVMACLVALVATCAANAAPITPVSITGTGTYNNNANLIINGVLPPRNTFWQNAANVWWESNVPPAGVFTIDYGSVYNITSLTIDVDNNDDYRVEFSTDGVTFTNLFDFLASYGPVQPSPGGMDILTTDPAFPVLPTNPGDLTTPSYVGVSLIPVQARYLRLTALNGDGAYSIGEFQAFGDPVPEPISLVVFGGLVLGGGLVARKRLLAKKAVA